MNTALNVQDSSRARSPKQDRLRTRYGPWALVTGASDGIGREIAAQLAEAGIHLILVARRRELLETIALELTQRSGVQVRTIAADLANRAELERVVTETLELEVGLLVAAAGFGTSGDFIRGDLEAEQAMLEVNCASVLALTHHFAGRFAARGRGGIVLMSSLLAFQGVPGAAHYAATKAYIQTLAEGLHLELAPKGVQVLASAPGPVNSGFAARANMKMGAALTPREVAQGTLNALLRGRTTVRPGLLSMFLEASLALLPRGARATLMAQVMRGMTRHQARV